MRNNLFWENKYAFISIPPYFNPPQKVFLKWCIKFKKFIQFCIENKLKIFQNAIRWKQKNSLFFNSKLYSSLWKVQSINQQSINVFFKVMLKHSAYKIIYNGNKIYASKHFVSNCPFFLFYVLTVLWQIKKQFSVLVN